MTHVVNPNDILIRHIGFNYVTPYITLQAAEDTTKCIHIAYVAEGYSKDEMTTFLEDARIATEALFEHEPFKSKRNRFNIIAVESTSEDSGTSVPSKVYGRIQFWVAISIRSIQTDTSQRSI